MNVNFLVHHVADLISGWPLILFVIITSIVCTIALNFVQFRKFIAGWRATLFPEHTHADAQQQVDMTPLQAFVNTLSASVGNGALAGMAVALYAGGPGAALWVLITAFAMLSVRFAEVYLSVYFANVYPHSLVGGPMLYLQQAAGGKLLSYLYTVCCLFFGFVGGNMIQTNSIASGMCNAWHICPESVAVALLLFTAYIVMGGASRIARASDMIVPVKVVLFFISALCVIIYNYHGIAAAFSLMVNEAFAVKSVVGGVMGAGMMSAMRFGMFHAIFATEAGLGTAPIFFSATGSHKPVTSALMSMIGGFVSTIVCFLVLLSILSSGALASGCTGIPLTIAAYTTVFGWFAPWLVTFLSIVFGIGVLVAYSYVSRAAWMTLTGGRYEWLFAISYALVACAGALVKVDFVWTITDIVNTLMIFINVCGVVWLLPIVRRGLQQSNHA